MAGFDKTQADELLALGQITPEQHAKFTVDTNLADAQPLPAPSADPNQSAWEQHVAEAKRKRDERAQTLGGEEDPDFVPAGLNRKSPMENYLIEKETDSVASGIESKQSEINAEREKYMAAGLTAEQANAMVKEKEAELDSIKKAVLPEHSLNPEVVGGIVPASAPAQEIEGPVQLAGDSVPGEIPGGGNFTEHLPQLPGYDTKQFDYARAGATMEAQAGAEHARRDAAYQQAYDDQAAQAEADREMVRLKEEAEMDSARQDLSDETDRVASLEIDTNRFWKNKSTGSKLASLAGIFLSGYASGGRSNAALAMLQKQISQDVEAQKADIANERAGVRNKQSMYGDLVAKYKNKEVAHNAMMAAGYKRFRGQLEQSMTQLRGDSARAGLVKQLAQIEGLEAGYRAKAEKALITQMAINRGDLSNMPEEYRKRYVPGQGYALTESDAKRVKEKMPTYLKSTSGIDQLLALSKKTGKSIDLGDRRKAQALANTLIGSLRVDIVGPGAMNEAELALMKSIVADPTKIFSLDSTNKVALETLRERVQNSWESELKSANLMPLTKKFNERDSRHKVD